MGLIDGFLHCSKNADEVCWEHGGQKTAKKQRRILIKMVRFKLKTALRSLLKLNQV